MKAFIPEVITAVCAITIIALFGVGTWIISLGKFDGAGMVSFVTSRILLIEPIQVVERKSSTTLEKVTGKIEFCNVAFRYKDTSKWVLNDFSLKVRARETVALVGPSGSGKSTLAKLRCLTELENSFG